MSLNIDVTIAEKLPNTVKMGLANMSEKEQLIFQEEVRGELKDTTVMVLLSIFFPIQLFLLGKTLLGIIFIFTGGGFYLWWFIELFLTPGRVKKFNEEIARKTFADIKLMSS